MTENPAVPTLALPFAVESMSAGSMVSPFGVVRWSKDRPEYGHSGIDIALEQDSEIYAVAAGEILVVGPTVDHREGDVITLLFEGSADGEGWGFLYEHGYLAEGLGAGSSVMAGDLLGTTPLDPEGANNHFQLTYLFHDFEFYRDHSCWVDFLQEVDGCLLLDRFSHVAPNLTVLWAAITEEDAYPYLALLDTVTYPDGLQMCYPAGTDVRSPAG